jgi:hypothetical protein
MSHSRSPTWTHRDGWPVAPWTASGPEFKLKERSRLVEQVRQYLEKQAQPRLAMLGILAETLVAGFLASVAMVHVGVDRMSLRYPVAVGFAYATFLGLLWGWLRRHQATALALSEDREGLFFVPAAAVGIAAMQGHNPDPDREKCRKDANGISGLGNLGGGGDFGAVAIVVLIAVICTLIVSVYLVMTSPALLAELLVDGALLGTMSRAVNADQSPHWSRGVLRRTWLAATITAIVFGLVGFGIERVAPGARTLGEAWAVERSHR